MTVLRWFALSLAILPAVASSASAQTPAAGADIPASLYVEGTPTFPAGKPGAVDIVAVGDPDSSSVPIVVRNNTDDAIELGDVVGVARDAQGKLAMTGEISDTVPFIVQPGQIAIGDVNFGDDIPAGLTFEFEAESNPVEKSSFSRQDIDVQEAVLKDDEVIGIVRNPTGSSLNGPFAVVVMCFDDAGEISMASGGYAAKDTLGPDATSPFSITLYGDGPCDSFIVGSTGWAY